MSDEKDSRDKQDEEEQATATKVTCFIVGVVCLLVFVGCVSLCTSSSDYDDRWDWLERSVGSDPYYDQW